MDFNLRSGYERTILEYQTISTYLGVFKLPKVIKTRFRQFLQYLGPLFFSHFPQLINQNKTNFKTIVQCFKTRAFLILYLNIWLV